MPSEAVLQKEEAMMLLSEGSHGCFCSAHQNCAEAAVGGCGACAQAVIADLRAQLATMVALECPSCGIDGAGQKGRIFRNLTTANDKLTKQLALLATPVADEDLRLELEWLDGNDDHNCGAGCHCYRDNAKALAVALRAAHAQIAQLGADVLHERKLGRLFAEQADKLAAELRHTTAPPRAAGERNKI